MYAAWEGDAFINMSGTSTWLADGQPFTLGHWDDSDRSGVATMTMSDNSRLTVTGGDFRIRGNFPGNPAPKSSLNEVGSDLPPEWTHQRPGDNEAADIVQLNLVLFNWNAMGATAAVPEPGSMALGLRALVGIFAGAAAGTKSPPALRCASVFAPGEFTCMMPKVLH